VEAMPQGGNLAVTLSAAKGQARIDFSDTGVGIPKDLLAKLPQPFLTSKVKGLGLGLSLSRRIVEKMSGQMKLFSEVGKGTTVSLTFPVARKS